MIVKTSHSLIVWCFLVGIHFIVKPLIRKNKDIQTRQPGKWVSFPNDLRVIENILHQDGGDWTRLIYVIVMAFLRIKKPLGELKLKLTCCILEPKWGPGCFDWSLGLVLGVWPSKIEVIWVPDVYRTNCYYAMFCWKCLFFFCFSLFWVYGTKC